MKYILDGNWVNDETVTELPVGALILTDEEWLNRSGVPDSVTLEEAQAMMWESIKSRRSLAEGAGAKVVINNENKWFHTSVGSRLQHLGLLMMGGALPSGIYWKTIDNTYVEMTPAVAGQVFNSIAALDLQSFQVAEQHKAAMLSVINPLTYDYSAGWPEQFSE